MRRPKLRVTVDRIEDGRLAVLTVHGVGPWVLPVKRLPRGLEEGQTYDVLLRRNRSAEKELRSRVRGLQRFLEARTRKRRR